MAAEFPTQHTRKSLSCKGSEDAASAQQVNFKKVNIEMADRFGRWLSAQMSV